MPEYFWIILASIISLVVGFAASYWISNKERRKRVEIFQNKLEKVTQKLDVLEKLNSVSDGTSQVKAKSYNPKSYSSAQLKEDILAVADRLEKIIEVLKTNPRSTPKKVKENKPKITIGNKRNDENIISNDISSSFEQLPFSSVGETESYSYAPRLDFQEPSAQITQLYNRGVDDRSDRDLFREKYAMTRLGNNKAVELRLGEVIEPEFRELDNGNFLAVSGDDGLFYVLPRFDTTLNSSAFNEGGFGYVFNCPDYNPDLAYTIVRVKRTSIFRRDGDNWTRIEKGELILQP